MRNELTPSKKISIALASFIISFLLLSVITEYLIRQKMPQKTYSVARVEGIHIFEDGKSIPFRLQKNVNNFHHIAYTREFEHYLSTNSHGTRGKDFSTEKDPDTFRILFIGDSMTFGWGVADDETYPFLIEQKLNEYARQNALSQKFEVINAAYASGKSFGSYYIYLNESVKSLKPDLAVLNFFPYNDMTDILETNWDQVDQNGLPQKISTKYEKVDRGYIVNKLNLNWKYTIPVLRDSHLAILVFDSMEARTPTLVKYVKKVLNVKDPPKGLERPVIDLCIHTLEPKYCPNELLDSYSKIKTLTETINEDLKENTSDLIVTQMPDPSQALPLAGKSAKAVAEAQPQKDMANFLKEKNIPNFDFLLPLSQGDTKSFFYEKDGHLNAKGNELTAQALFDFLVGSYFSF